MIACIVALYQSRSGGYRAASGNTEGTMSGRPQVIRPAAYVLVTRGDSLLMCRLDQSEKDAGKWTLPGGGLDFGESPEDGAVREAKEETGLDVSLGELIEVQSQVFEFPDRDMHAIRFVYTVGDWRGDIQNEIDGSTDCCAFIPFEALDPGYRHPEFGAVVLVDLAERGLELARNRLATL